MTIEQDSKRTSGRNDEKLVARHTNPVRAVGASPVILSPNANVCVSLSYVRVFRTVKT